MSMSIRCLPKSAKPTLPMIAETQKTRYGLLKIRTETQEIRTDGLDFPPIR